MNKIILNILMLCVIISCDNSNSSTPDKKIKIGMMAEDFGDNSYNDNCKRGLLDAQNDFNFITEFRDGVDSLVMKANVEYYIKENYDLLFYAGYQFFDISLEYAKKYPQRKFVMIDYDRDTIPSNMIGINFEVQEAAFPLGFLAAFWADIKNPGNPKTAAISGYDSKTLQKFYVAFDNGVKYYNTKNGKSVSNSTAFTFDFVDKQIGRRIADSLLDGGVSVIFTIAGECGAGALESVSESGKWGIGVDDDQYLTLPSVKNCLLSSCMKNTRVPIYDLTKEFVNGKFNGGTIYKSNLNDAGVGIAPFHNFEQMIPDSIKSQINRIKADIVSGKLNPL